MTSETQGHGGPPLDPETLVTVNEAYDRIYSLLLESEDYLNGGGNSRPTRDLAAHDRMFMINQEMRITARLGSALAWLMMVRAFDAGEVGDLNQSLEDVDPFDTATCCLDTESHKDSRLPDRLRDLLRQSHKVYLHVVEMDVSFRNALSPGH